MSAVRRVCIPVGNLTPVGPDPGSTQQTVLLVTGDANLRASASRVLEAQGYNVITAAHSGHALLAGMTQPHVDIIATELTADDVSGPALATRLRRHFPNVQTLYLANPGTPECEGVLVRPFTRDELLAAIELVWALPA